MGGELAAVEGVTPHTSLSTHGHCSSDLLHRYRYVRYARRVNRVEPHRGWFEFEGPLIQFRSFRFYTRNVNRASACASGRLGRRAISPNPSTTATPPPHPWL